MDDFDDNVVELEDHRPHFVLRDSTENVRVFPVALIEDIIQGRMVLTDVEDWEPMMRAILGDWMGRVIEDGP